ncbi:MAG: alpha/beta fold hydrolase [Ferruginibacter sp.]
MKQIVHGGCTIHYRVFGSGKPLVLLHGFGMSGSVWNKTAIALSSQFQVIVPDLAGTSESLASIPTDWTLEQHAESIHAILSYEQIDRVTMIGHSMGGYIALSFADRYQQHLQGMGLFCSTAYADSNVRKQNRVKAIAFIQQHGTLAYLKTSIPTLFAPQYRSDPMVASLIAENSRIEADTLIAYQAAMCRRTDYAGWLNGSKIPLLLVAGEQDEIIPLQESLTLCGRAMVTEWGVLPGTGHMAMLEQPEMTVEVIQHFMRTLSIVPRYGETN